MKKKTHKSKNVILVGLCSQLLYGDKFSKNNREALLPCVKGNILFNIAFIGERMPTVVISTIYMLLKEALKEVKWVLGSITSQWWGAGGGDGIPAELFQILKDDAVKVLHSICQQIWKTHQWPQEWKKVSFHSNSKERQCQRILKLLHNCTHLTS